MKIVFTKDYLEQLYRDGKAKSKKYRFPKGVVPKYRETIDKLRAADRIEDLYPIKSLNYEKLIGEKRGVESVRVNRQYRIEFISSVEGADECTIAICSIIELSKHYQ
jgi:toxin HigB-1